jgi:hypothetical protein
MTKILADFKLNAKLDQSIGERILFADNNVQLLFELKTKSVDAVKNLLRFLNNCIIEKWCQDNIQTLQDQGRTILELLYQIMDFKIADSVDDSDIKNDAMTERHCVALSGYFVK